MFCSSWTINSASLLVIELFKILIPCWEKCGHLFFLGGIGPFISVAKLMFVELFVPWPFHVRIVCNNTLFHSTILLSIFSLCYSMTFFPLLIRIFHSYQYFQRSAFFIYFSYFYFLFNWFLLLYSFFLLALGLFFTFPPSCLSLEA